MASKIQDRTLGYRICKRIVDFYTHRSYRKIQIEGTENIPSDGCVIWSSNHTNALMDPLVSLASTRRPKVYLARADIFRSSPLIVKILTFLKIMPIYRIRDGFESVKHNDEIIDHTVDVLTDNTPVCLYPEATHRARHSLLKLSKGIFHIAFAVNGKTAGTKPVLILPIGIDYGDYFRYRSTALIRFGKPIDVSGFLQANSELTQPQQMQKLRDILAEKMSELIAFVPDDEDYDAVWEYAKLKSGNREYYKRTLSECERIEGRKLKGLLGLQAVNRHAIAEALAIRRDDPEKARKLFADIDAQRVWRIHHGVSVRSIARPAGRFRTIARTFVSLLGLPYFLFSGLATLIVWLPTLFILRRVDDDAFYNTARMGTRFALSWIYVLGLGITFLCTMPLWTAVIFILLLLPAYSYIYDYREYARRTISDIRWLISGRKAVSC